MSNKKQSPQRRKTKTEEDNSVTVDTIDGVAIKLTPMNQVYLIRGETMAFPSLRGSNAVVLDSSTFTISERLKEYLRVMLRKQRDIRDKWVRDGDLDEGDAWTFH